MSFAIEHRFANRFARVLLGLPRFQKAKVLGPGNIYRQFEPVLGGQVEKPSRRHIIKPEKIAANCAKLRKVARSFVRRCERPRLLSRSKRPVSDSFGEEFVCAKTKKFPVHADSGREC